MQSKPGSAGREKQAGLSGLDRAGQTEQAGHSKPYTIDQTVFNGQGDTGDTGTGLQRR